MRKTSKGVKILMIVTVAAILLLFGVLVFAQGNCNGHSCNDSDGPDIDISPKIAPIIGSESSSGSSAVASFAGGDSLALGFGAPSFAAAINDCMGTNASSWLFNLHSRQRMTENHWCQAVNLIKAGYVEGGEWILCNKTILSSMPGCPGEITLAIVETPPPPPPPEDDTWQMGQMELYADLQTKVALLEDELEEAKQRPVPAPQVIERTVIESKPLLTSEQAEALRIRE